MRLHHVSIPVRPDQLDAGRAFYTRVFGMREVVPPESLGTGRVVWFQLGECELHLFVEEDANAIQSGRHLALAVDDLEAVRQQVEAAGAAFEEATPIHNRPRFFCRDPFGNRVEVTQILGPYR
jgi:catechol 2,3-dioxygenase-like lactoylglutathione lyase family enzyme